MESRRPRRRNRTRKQKNRAPRVAPAPRLDQEMSEAVLRDARWRLAVCKTSGEGPEKRVELLCTQLPASRRAASRVMPGPGPGQTRHRRGRRPGFIEGYQVVGREGFEPPKAFRQLIYSQPPLAAWVPPRSSQSVGATAKGVNERRASRTSRNVLREFRRRAGARPPQAGAARPDLPDRRTAA
jgi:hypothetical protein